VQHCEVAGLSDWLDAKLYSGLRLLAKAAEWKVETRVIREAAVVHPTVAERFALADVKQCAGFGSYRPEALPNHHTFRTYY
jgi:hypothetical protein